MALFCRIPPRELSNPEYATFDSIGRAMHIDDALTCCSIKDLNSFTVPSSAHSCLSMSGMKVMWFGVCQSSYTQNWYGNISFQMKLKNLLNDHPDLKLYFLEHVQFRKDTISRVMITKKPRNLISNDIIEMDLTKKGYPIWKDEFGGYHHLTNHTRLDKECNRFGHTVEFVIDAADGISKFLFEECSRIPVNHIKANTRGRFGKYQDKVCFKFNKNGTVCPFNFGNSETTITMNKGCPGFWTGNNQISPSIALSLMTSNSTVCYYDDSDDSDFDDYDFIGGYDYDSYDGYSS